MRTAALYAGLLGLMLIVLMFYVSQDRKRAGVSIGDGGDEVLRRRIRAHANFTEYVPLTVLLLALSEHLGLGALFIHILGLILLAARAAHAYGISQPEEVTSLRMFGMLGTVVVLACCAIYCILAFF